MKLVMSQAGVRVRARAAPTEGAATRWWRRKIGEVGVVGIERLGESSGEIREFAV